MIFKGFKNLAERVGHSASSPIPLFLATGHGVTSSYAGFLSVNWKTADRYWIVRWLIQSRQETQSIRHCEDVRPDRSEFLGGKTGRWRQRDAGGQAHHLKLV